VRHCEALTFPRTLGILISRLKGDVEEFFMNNEQRIIGTWIDQRGAKWIFDANGELIKDNSKLKYGVTDTSLALKNNPKWLRVFNLSISSDGKTLILIEYDGIFDSSNNDINGHFWLTKV
jgi:hypothetical protein